MREILFHPLGGLMSAYGIGLARPAKRSSKTVLLEYSADSHTVLASILDEMVKETVPAEWSEGVLKRMEVDLRPLGADTCLTIEFTGYETTRALFEETYKKLFGFFPGKTLIEAVNLRLEVGRVGDYFPAYRPAGPAGPAGRNVASGPDKDIEPHSFRKVIYHGTELEAPVYVRGALPHSFKVMGPAILVDEYSSLVIDPGFEAGLAGPAGPACDGIVVVKRVASEKACLQKRAEGPRGGAAAGVAARPDPVLLEVFNNLFMGVATEMGHVLQMTAHSVNIKERLDFSCALFDANADLVASAQHIPVHIGAMSDIVRAIMEDKGGGMAPGDVYVSNNPFRGGTHLPDVTVIEPVFSESGEIIFFVAARGHHADIGGKTPGSLPPVCSHIDEEGVLLDGVLILRDGRFRERELRDILSTHKYPARNPDERISDIKAQMASCSRGVDELNAIIDRYGLDTVSLYMGYIQENAEYAVKRALYGFLTDAGFPGAPGSRFESGFADALDDGTPIKVKVTIKSGKNPPETLSACIDFTGTGPWHASDNLNAPLPVTRSAVLYVLKTLIEADIPLNSGCLKPVEIIVPEGSLLNPAYPAPVGSGNVETSQRVVDVLLGALGIAAASQGTMNNLLFEVHGETPYYETIAGGSGAMDNCEGASGVQVHMTNTRITDPEVLEFRHPGVRLERFSLRRGSGGKGEFAGGDGVVREIRFLKPATVSIISERRVRAPYGLNGGSSGKRGENLLKRADGEMVRLGHRAFVHVKEGESVIIKTPGGGGYGKKAD
jgi:5-oxoprolinase (ATP-hydrolysing)